MSTYIRGRYGPIDVDAVAAYTAAVEASRDAYRAATGNNDSVARTHGGSKAREARRLRAEGWAVGRIAQKLGLSRSTVYNYTAPGVELP